MENLEFIRDAMARSTQFTAVPGYGGVLMGVTAIGASVVARYQPTYRLWLLTWLVEAALAFLIGLFAVWQKSKSAETAFASLPARKFAMGFAPPIVAGVIITLLMIKMDMYSKLPTVWLSLYGTAVVTGGAFSVRAVPVMGWLFLALGAISLLFPAGYGWIFMILGFGGLHIVFGAIIGAKYGG
ncbi:MAG: hypothetical protein R2684_03640 [Pyrinomonadaceae bacterium]